MIDLRLLSFSYLPSPISLKNIFTTKEIHFGVSSVDPDESLKLSTLQQLRGLQMLFSLPKFAKLNLPKSLLLGAISIAAIVGAINLPQSLMASDHDDGEVDTKGRNLNLTDLYAYREKDQNQGAADGDLVLTMNTNPRSVARHQYYFSTNARYEFKLTRVADKDATPTGQEDVTLRFEFAPPNDQNQQQIKQAKEAQTGDEHTISNSEANTQNLANPVKATTAPSTTDADKTSPVNTSPVNTSQDNTIQATTSPAKTSSAKKVLKNGEENSSSLENKTEAANGLADNKIHKKTPANDLTNSDQPTELAAASAAVNVSTTIN